VLLGDDIRLALLLLLNAGVLVPAWLVTRHWTADGVQRLADALLIWFAVQYVSVCAPGILHVLSPVTMAVTALIVSGGVLSMALRSAHGHRERGEASGVSARVAKSLGASQDDKTAAESHHYVFLAAGAFVIAIIAGVIYKQNLLPIVDSDAMTYHVPAAVSWLRSGKLGLFPVWFFNPANSFSPLAGSAFIAWLLAPLNDPVLARAVQAPPLILLFLATLQLGRALGLSEIVAALIAVGCAVSRPFNSEVMAARDDVFLAAFVVVALAGCGGEAVRDRFAPWRIGLAVGLAAATKYTFAFAAPILLLAIDAPTRAGGWTWRRRGIAIACAFSVAGPWYLRNLLLTGNPIYPVEAALSGHRLLPGLFRPLPSERLRTIAGLRDVLIRGFHAPPRLLLAVLLIGWLVSVIAAWRDLLRLPLVRASVLGPPLCLALFIGMAPYGEVRFLFPSLAPAYAAVGLAICRWHLPSALSTGIAAVVAAISLFTSFAATWLVAEIAVPAVLATAAVLLLVWVDRRVGGSRRVRGYAAAVALLALAVPIYVYWPSYVRHCHEIQPYFHSQQYPHLAGGWLYISDHVPPDTTIAYTNTYLVYPLAGSPPFRRTLYVPVRPDVLDFLHLPRFPAPVSGEHIEETFSRLLCDHPDRQTWLRRLLDSDATCLYVARTKPIGDPPELGFAASDPEHFTRLFEDDGAAIYRVNRR
jgi:hypothetical protein